MNPGWTEKVVEGITVEYSACEHCGRIPSEKELLGVVARQREDKFLRGCDHCGKEILIERIQVLHSKTVNHDQWGSVATTLEPVVNVNIEGQDLRMHLSCVKKTFPKADFSRFEKRRTD